VSFPLSLTSVDISTFNAAAVGAALLVAANLSVATGAVVQLLDLPVSAPLTLVGASLPLAPAALAAAQAAVAALLPPSVSVAVTPSPSRRALLDASLRIVISGVGNSSADAISVAAAISGPTLLAALAAAVPDCMGAVLAAPVTIGATLRISIQALSADDVSLATALAASPSAQTLALTVGGVLTAPPPSPPPPSPPMGPAATPLLTDTHLSHAAVLTLGLSIGLGGGAGVTALIVAFICRSRSCSPPARAKVPARIPVLEASPEKGEPEVNKVVVHSSPPQPRADGRSRANMLLDLHADSDDDGLESFRP